MDVRLYKQEEVDFNLAEDKCERLSYKTLCMLTDYNKNPCKVNISNSPRMVAFKTKEEFHRDAHKYDIDTEKEILINQKGNIFCYLKEENGTHENTKNEDAPADTK